MQCTIIPDEVILLSNLFVGVGFKPTRIYSQKKACYLRHVYPSTGISVASGQIFVKFDKAYFC